MSGETSVVRGPCAVLGAIVKAASPTAASGRTSTPVTTASAGGRSRSAATNPDSAAGGPSASISTPVSSLPTNPASPNSAASACTNGRNPTPCTIPATRMRVRAGAVTGWGWTASACCTSSHSTW